MCENHLEDVLATYANEFFPDRGFRLVGRQESLHGVGRFDLLFQDSQLRHWLIELKAVPLRITDTDQVMGYYEELRERNKLEVFIPFFVAPNIPAPVRHYLDNKGIEYREITIGEFRRVAQEQNYGSDCPFFGFSERAPSPVAATSPRRRSSLSLPLDETGIETVFPLDKAYPFAMAHGLEKKVGEIRSMNFPLDRAKKVWGRQRGSTVRRWHMIQLLKANNLLEQFYGQYWPIGLTGRGPHEEDRCLKAKEVWDRNLSL